MGLDLVSVFIIVSHKAVILWLPTQEADDDVANTAFNDEESINETAAMIEKEISLT